MIGLGEVLTAGYAGGYSHVLGQNVQLVVPYLMMTAFLLVRPYGMFGTRTVRRA